MNKEICANLHRHADRQFRRSSPSYKWVW